MPRGEGAPQFSPQDIKSNNILPSNDRLDFEDEDVLTSAGKIGKGKEKESAHGGDAGEKNIPLNNELTPEQARAKLAEEDKDLETFTDAELAKLLQDLKMSETSPTALANDETNIEEYDSADLIEDEEVEFVDIEAAVADQRRTKVEALKEQIPLAREKFQKAKEILENRKKAEIAQRAEAESRTIDEATLREIEEENEKLFRQDAEKERQEQIAQVRAEIENYIQDIDEIEDREFAALLGTRQGIQAEKSIARVNRGIDAKNKIEGMIDETLGQIERGENAEAFFDTVQKATPRAEMRGVPIANMKEARKEPNLDSLNMARDQKALDDQNSQINREIQKLEGSLTEIQREQIQLMRGDQKILASIGEENSLQNSLRLGEKVLSRIHEFFEQNRKKDQDDEQAEKIAELQPDLEQYSKDIDTLEQRHRLETEQTATEKSIREVNQQIALDQLTQQRQNQKEHIRQGIDEAESIGLRPVTEAMRAEKAARAERQARIEQAKRKQESSEAIATYKHLDAITQAKANPDILSPQLQEISDQNKALLKGPVADLIVLAKAKYGVTLSREGKVNPSFFDKAKSLWSGTKAPDNDPFFKSIQAELKARANNIQNAKKSPLERFTQWTKE